MILAIETATPVCSVALRTKNGRITEKRVEGQGVHSEKTFLFIQELLERANLGVSELDAVLFSNGPGSYTGLRIGAAAIKGLLFRKDIPLYTFPTLLSFATPSVLDKKTGTVHAVIDARREHLYTQQVKDSGKTVSEPQIMRLNELEKMIDPGDTIVGTGWDRLTLKEKEKLNLIGSEGISAVNLIKAFGDPTLQKQFKKADVETYEPDYLTMAQINNSPIQR
jgi:tRNA threonylcarbamoyladenosine biosynthesis protein TsaB